MIKAVFREPRSCKCFSLSLRNHNVSRVTKIECKGTAGLSINLLMVCGVGEEGRVVC